MAFLVRDAVFEAIERLDGYHCVRMENFGARATPTAEFCEQAVKSCNIFVGIVGQRSRRFIAIVH
jgi:hypothetical protein